jgi:polysaccharide lyase-like protein
MSLTPSIIAYSVPGALPATVAATLLLAPGATAAQPSHELRPASVRAERGVLLGLDAIWRLRKRQDPLVDGASGVPHDNIRAACRPTRDRAGWLRCIVQPAQSAHGARLSFLFRPRRDGRFRVARLRYRRPPHGATSLAKAPVAAAVPAIDADPVIDQLVRGTDGAWRRVKGTLAYQWRRCPSGGSCSAIQGATSASYQPGSNDAGSALRVSVIASNATGSTIATSPPRPVSPAPQPTPPAFFVGDFDTGDLSQWPYLGDAHGISVVPSPTSDSAYAARVVTTNVPDSSIYGDGSYVQQGSFDLPWENAGADVWHHMNLLLPSGNDPRYPGRFKGYVLGTPMGGWNDFMEWHNRPGFGRGSSFVGTQALDDGSHILLLRIWGGTEPDGVQVRVEGPRITFDHWYDILVRQRWSSDPAVGYVEWWVDGTRRWAGNAATLWRDTDGSNGGGDGGVLFEVGHYRYSADWTDTVYVDGVKVGPTRDSVR